MAYRAHDLVCPTCGKQLEPIEAVGRRFRRCPDCHGAWVEEATLAGMFTDMRTGALPARLPFGGEPQPEGRPRACPDCEKPMLQIGLARVTVDRCEQGHGIWFDRYELETSLRGSVSADLDPAPDASMGVLRTILNLLVG